ncbi:hypothetical protein NDU88_009344 [Pleurodeles waltl]|uniref:Uncharacterized protein n=1 Tax=Pleurodeles waltl TaxID=8319 RepID=A0AAV7QUA2_PLEWA|nr:hypothetical protein NDU88_009344 [Pleurodeles waltl]
MEKRGHERGGSDIGQHRRRVSGRDAGRPHTWQWLESHYRRQQAHEGERLSHCRSLRPEGLEDAASSVGRRAAERHCEGRGLGSGTKGEQHLHLEANNATTEGLGEQAHTRGGAGPPYLTYMQHVEKVGVPIPEH